MSIKNRNTLKAEFTSGLAATQEKFENVIDSSYNREEDSVLMGPTGITGTFGLIGPIGGTHNGVKGPAGSTHYIGLFLSTLGTAPTGPVSSGMTGEVFLGASGSTAYAYIHDGTNWIRFIGETNW